MKDIGDLDGSVLLFGGPYSNLHATRAMHDEATRLGIPPDNVICSGDIVAYCADPVATVSLIREWGVHCVMGNCEESLASGADDCGCGFNEGSLCSLLSAEWYRFASTRVSPDQKRWMGTLPRCIRFTMGARQFAVVHGSLDNISEFVFASTPAERKLPNLKQARADCVIGGHAGLPFGEILRDADGKPDPGYWLNTGVIGMPANDGTRDGWYLLLEPHDSGNSIHARWQRLAYDYEGASNAMIAAEQGPAYRDALDSGLWPSMDILPTPERDMQGQALAPAPVLIS